MTKAKSGEVLIAGDLHEPPQVGEIEILPREALQQSVNRRGAHGGKTKGKPGPSQGFATFTGRVTLSGMTVDEFKALSDPATLSLPLQALWRDLQGDWDGAHDAAQQAGDRDGAWVHAYLHRKEGDAGNAAYWYNRAHRPMPQGSLADEWTAIARALLNTSPRPEAED